MLEHQWRHRRREGDMRKKVGHLDRPQPESHKSSCLQKGQKEDHDTRIHETTSTKSADKCFSWGSSGSAWQDGASKVEQLQEGTGDHDPNLEDNTEGDHDHLDKLDKLPPDLEGWEDEWQGEECDRDQPQSSLRDRSRENID